VQLHSFIHLFSANLLPADWATSPEATIDSALQVKLIMVTRESSSDWSFLLAIFGVWLHKF
jgi:hypothetical protein